MGQSPLSALGTGREVSEDPLDHRELVTECDDPRGAGTVRAERRIGLIHKGPPDSSLSDEPDGILEIPFGGV